MWAITNWSKKVKLIVTAVVVVIPLLVIAFLSLVVTTSLSGARQNAQDARIHATIMQTRSLAELVHNTATPMAYNDLCNNSNNGLNIGHATYGAALEALNAEVIEQTGNSAGLKCFASGENYCVSAPLASKGYSCISSSGSFNSPTATACATATDCR
jgi:hypothetical protein